MKLNLADFQETLPYASELFGVYQPLLGWRSKMIQRRVDKGRLRALIAMTGFGLSRFKAAPAAPGVNGTGLLTVPPLADPPVLPIAPVLDRAWRGTCCRPCRTRRSRSTGRRR